MNTKKIERKRYAALTIYHTEWQSFTFSHITDLSHGPKHPSAMGISGYLSDVCVFTLFWNARFPVACLKWVNLLMKTDRFNEIHLVIAIHQHNQQNQVSSIYMVTIPRHVMLRNVARSHAMFNTYTSLCLYWELKFSGGYFMYECVSQHSTFFKDIAAGGDHIEYILYHKPSIFYVRTKSKKHAHNNRQYMRTVSYAYDISW